MISLRIDFFLLTLRKSSAAFTFTFGFLGTFVLLMISVVQEFQHPYKHPLCTTISTAPARMYRVHRLIEIRGFIVRPYLYYINLNNYISYLHKTYFGMPVLCNWNSAFQTTSWMLGVLSDSAGCSRSLSCQLVPTK